MVSTNEFWGDDTPDSVHVLTPGDIVKLREPYKPEEWKLRLGREWKGFTFGIVAQITATEIVGRSRTSPGQRLPRNVALHLYDDQGQLFIYLPFIENKYPLIPTYVDFHVSEFDLYHAAGDEGYLVRPVMADKGRQG